MKKEMLQMIHTVVATSGFVLRKQSFFRLTNDVVQGFQIDEKHSKKMNFYTVTYCTNALSNPEANFYHWGFGPFEIGNMMPTYARWPFWAATDDIEKQEECVTSINQAIEQYLIPYFTRYNSCIIASNGLPELEPFGLKNMDAVHFALKANQREKAIAGLEGMLAVWEAAHIRNETVGIMPSDETLQREEALKAFYSFVNGAMETEIQDYLAKNEQRARNYLQRQT